MKKLEISSKAFKELLEREKLLCELNEGPDEMPFDQLLVSMGEDRLGNEITIQIGLLRPMQEEKSIAEGPKLQLIQFFVLLPVEVHKEHKRELQHFLQYLNLSCELPGFNLLDEERLPSFRHVLVVTGDYVDEDQFLMTLGLVMLMMENCIEVMRDFAEGKKTLASIESKARD